MLFSGKDVAATAICYGELRYRPTTMKHETKLLRGIRPKSLPATPIGSGFLCRRIGCHGILGRVTSDTGDAMPILRLIAKVRNVLPFRTAKTTQQRKFTLAEFQALAEQGDFGEILTAAGVPDIPSPEAVPNKWSKGKEFDASKFDASAYNKYQKDFFKK